MKIMTSFPLMETLDGQYLWFQQLAESVLCCSGLLCSHFRELEQAQETNDRMVLFPMQKYLLYI